MLLSASAFAQLTPGFVPSKIQGCSPLPVVFSNTTAGAVSYFWDFGNGNTSTSQHPSATFITPGTYTVSLTAKNATGASLSATRTITVFSSPVADFAAAKTGACVNDPVSFTDLSVNGTNPIVKWSWDFGDGSSSLLQAPAAHAYTFGDRFKITLVVEDQFGCRGTAVKNNYIDVTDLRVDFSNASASACEGPLTVQFRNQTTPADPRNIYTWDFGDGHTSPRTDDSNTYLNKGVYPVTLTAVSPNGCKGVVTKSGAVAIHAPKAGFRASLTKGCQPLSVRFENTSASADPAVATYRWSTSAGHTSTAKDPEFIFTEPGIYSVSLRMTIPGICSDSLTKTGYIEVVPRSDVSVSASALSFCAVPAQVNFSVIPQESNVVAWLWGDSTSGTSPVKTYTAFGSFRVKAVVENTTGCRDTVSLTAPVVIRPPGFKLVLSKKKGCAPFNVSMRAADTGMMAMTAWQWTLNGMPAGNTDSTFASITDTGIYVVACTGTNSQGCVFTVTDTIKAGAATYPQYTFNKQTSCANDALFTFTNHTNQQTPRAGSWHWSFSDNTSSQDEHPVHRYADTGTFRISLTSIHNGCSTTVENRQVTVLGPKTKFTKPSLNCNNDSLLFANTSKGGHWLMWDFGDGRTTSARSPKHKYAVEGTYQVVLVAKDTLTGCADTATATMIIPRMELPVVAFTVSASSVCPGEALTVTDQTTGSEIKSWGWLVSNGQAASGKSAVLRIRDTGYHHLQLFVKDARGCQFQLKKDSAIRVYPGAALFLVSDTIGCMPLAVKTTDRSITTFPVTKRAWKWGTGDSAESNVPEFSYTYAKTPGMQSAGYTAELVVTDSMGCVYSAKKTIRPLKPVAGYTTATTRGCGFDSVSFLPASTTGGFAPFRFCWASAADTLSKLAAPVFRFTLPDTAFTATLTVTDAFGCSSVFASAVKTDSRKPLAAFGASPQRILDCPGPPIFFADSTVRGASGIKSWEWSFGDQTRSMLASPVKTFLEPGSYDISLKITDSLGCESSVAKSGYVQIAGPVASYKIISKSGCLPLATSFEAASSNTRKFEWDMGDGITDSSTIHRHVYTRSGKFIPSLSITDSAGCRRVLPVKDTVEVFSVPAPAFTNNKNRICAGSDVSFSNGSNHDKKLVLHTWYFGDGDSLVTTDHAPVAHTYLRAGKFDVALKVVDELGCARTAELQKQVTVLKDSVAPAVPQVLRSTVIDNESVLLQFRKNEESDFEKYTVYYQYNPAGKAGKTDSILVSGDTAFVQSGINTLNSRYFYSVSATDVCRNESERSVLHGTIDLTASPAINSVSLQWSAYKGWNTARYEIYRSSDNGTTYASVARVQTGVTQFTDTTVLCHQAYSYRVKAVEEGGNLQESWSDTSSAVPVFRSTIPNTSNVRVTVTENARVLLEWRKQVHTLRFVPVLYRSVNNEEPVFYRELNTQDTFFIDSDVDVSRNSYTYITYLKDNCGALSQASNPARTILLAAELGQTERKDYNPQLSWSSYIDWKSGVDRYVVEFKYDSLGKFTDKTATDKLTFFDSDIDEKQRKYCYRITAYEKGNPTVFSRSNQVCVSTDPQLFAPTAFTPNGDGLNETFRISGVFMEEFNLKIWNRYGELVYESNNMLEGWDATFRGEAAPADAYTYLAEGRGRAGKFITAKGSVTILR